MILVLLHFLVRKELLKDVVKILQLLIVYKTVRRIKENDDKGNVVNGNVVTVNTENCVIEGDKKLIATVGLRDMIIV